MNGPRGVRGPVGALAPSSATKPTSAGPAVAPIKNGAPKNIRNAGTALLGTRRTGGASRNGRQQNTMGDAGSRGWVVADAPLSQGTLSGRFGRLASMSHEFAAPRNDDGGELDNGDVRSKGLKPVLPWRIAAQVLGYLGMSLCCGSLMIFGLFAIMSLGLWIGLIGVITPPDFSTAAAAMFGIGASLFVLIGIPGRLCNSASNMCRRRAAKRPDSAEAALSLRPAAKWHEKFMREHPDADELLDEADEYLAQRETGYRAARGVLHTTESAEDLVRKMRG